MKFTLHGKIGSFSGSYEKNKKEAEQGAALQAVLELRLMTPEDCGLEIKKIDERHTTIRYHYMWMIVYEYSMTPKNTIM